MRKIGCLLWLWAALALAVGLAVIGTDESRTFWWVVLVAIMVTVFTVD